MRVITVQTRGHGRVAILLLGVLLLVPSLGPCRETPVVSQQDRFHPVFAPNGIIATQEQRATRVGLEVLRAGGNAVDAAVAIGFALAVTLPRAGNLGGGGFMLIHDAKTATTVALDYREVAPSAATRDMYLDTKGGVDTERARYSYLSAGVPGTVAGFALAAERYGTRPWKALLEPAIRLAEEGIEVSQDLADSLSARRERLAAWPQTKRIFFNSDGSPFEAGDRLVQRELAWSLRQIAESGPEAFYEGEIARRIASDMSANGGLITLEDLKGYQALVREPVWGTYRGYEIASMPPPSSGGVHLIQILNILEGYPIGYLGHNSAQTIHLMAEAMKLAYADRSKYLGDPDFVQVPVDALISKAYARSLRATIDRHRARPAEQIAPGAPQSVESNETTHFSVMDGFGNAVSNTYTINFSYGSGIVAAGTGILLNNEMDDFSAKPGVANAYGLIGGDANAVESGKRPLSSMTPTVVFKDGSALLATGSPGGPRIITTTLQVIMNMVDHRMNIAAASFAPRIHHQWLPDELRIESGLSPDTTRLLVEKGHRIVEKDAMGSVQSVMTTEGGFFGASDPRRVGALTLGF